MLGQRVLVMRRPGTVASELDVAENATPAQLAELRGHVLETMAAMKQAAEPWHRARADDA